MKKFLITIAVAASVLAVLPAFALALEAGKSVYDTKSLRGTGCGRHYAVGFTLARRSHAIRIFGPGKGKTLRDLSSGRRVARVTGRVRLRLRGRKKFVGIGYVSRGAACKHRHRVRNWRTSDIRLRVAFRRQVRVFVKLGATRQHAPGTLYFGASGYVYDMHWNGRDRHTVHGTGTFNYNNCIPYCAAGKLTPYPAEVKLSKPRNCGGTYFYGRFRLKLAGGPPGVGVRTGIRCRFINGTSAIHGPEVIERRAHRRRLN